MQKNSGDVRAALIEKINGAIANMYLAEKRVNDANSELGTAKHDFLKCKEEYEKLRGRLDELLPSVTAA